MASCVHHPFYQNRLRIEREESEIHSTVEPDTSSVHKPAEEITGEPAENGRKSDYPSYYEILDQPARRAPVLPPSSSENFPFGFSNADAEAAQVPFSPRQLRESLPVEKQTSMADLERIIYALPDMSQDEGLPASKVGARKWVQLVQEAHEKDKKCPRRKDWISDLLAKIPGIFCEREDGAQTSDSMERLQARKRSLKAISATTHDTVSLGRKNLRDISDELKHIAERRIQELSKHSTADAAQAKKKLHLLFERGERLLNDLAEKIRTCLNDYESTLSTDLGSRDLYVKELSRRCEASISRLVECAWADQSSHYISLATLEDVFLEANNRGTDSSVKDQARGDRNDLGSGSLQRHCLDDFVLFDDIPFCSPENGSS